FSGRSRVLSGTANMRVLTGEKGCRAGPGRGSPTTATRAHDGAEAVTAPQLRAHLPRVDAFVADAVHRVGDRHVDTEAHGQRPDRRARHDALGDLPAGRRLRLFEGLAAAEALPERAVARKRR